MDATERFTDVVRRAERDVPLDEAAFLIAAHDHALDVVAQLARLDDLAADAPASADALATFLFVERGFVGNSVDYGEPANSFLDAVLDRRLGLPITLSVLMLEVGRRRGLELGGVGMPGHFLVRAGSSALFDPFHGGERLDEDACRERFVATQGDKPFLPEYLDPIGSHAILARMLANLVRTFVARDPASAVWALRLRLRVPGVSAAERREAAALLGSLGQFEEAAEELDAIAEELDAIAEQLDGDAANRVERDAAAYRARAN
jgi:regulator of sirC expression with transglutaminase-like and TPR domain